ncbi:MAG TPA: helix-turn-helix domain-containing protein [Actinomycetes bacterium]|nr:helix-turn-helix domain-containing protein [Actinomycetes bacterium]
MRPPPSAQRIEHQRATIAQQVHAAIARDLPPNADVLRQGIVTAVAQNLPVLLPGWPEDAGQEFDLTPVRTTAARAAAEQIPLEVPLRALHAAVSSVVEAVWLETGDAERQRLVASSMGLAKVMTEAFSSAYLAEWERLRQSRSTSVQAVAESLVQGNRTEVLADHAGVELATSYVVVALSIATPGDDAGDNGSDRKPAARRRTLEHVLHSHASEALGLLTESGGLLLLPVEENPNALYDRIRELVAELAGALGGTGSGGVAWRPTRQELPDAVAEAREILWLVKQLGRPPGVYVLDNVLLEAAIARSARVHARLVELVKPLHTGPDLIATLVAYFDADFQRRKAAAALHVHPNTLDYRLRRIHELTGVSPLTSDGANLLSAALTALRLWNEDHTPS